MAMAQGREFAHIDRAAVPNEYRTEEGTANQRGTDRDGHSTIQHARR